MRYIFLTAICFSFVACKSTDEVTDNAVTKYEPLSYDVVYEGEMSGGGAEGINEGLTEIKDLIQLKELRKQVNGESNDGIPQLEFDFENHRIFFYADKIRPRLDYKLKITSVAYQNSLSKILIQIESIKPEKTSGERLSQPYLVFSCRKVDGNVEHSITETNQ